MGCRSRIGIKFNKALEEIKDSRFKKLGKAGKISAEEITNMITHHKHWREIVEEIIESPEEEIKRYGK